MIFNRLQLPRFLAWMCWAIWLLVLFFPILPAADTWWHLASGRWLTENGWLPAPQDPFTFGSGIDAWLNHQWLCQIFFYGVYVLAGLDGLYILRSVLLILAFAVLPLALCRHKGGNCFFAALGILVLVGLAQGEAFFDARCYIFTYLLLSAELYILNRYSDAYFGRPRLCSPFLSALIHRRYLYFRPLGPLLLLPVLTALGSNLHGGFGILLAVQGVCAFAYSFMKYKLKRAVVLWGILAASLVLTALCNPYHTDILLFPFSMLKTSVFQIGLNEWQRPQPEQMGAVAALAIVLLGGLRRWNLPQLLLGIFFLALGCTAWRHAPLVSLVSVYLWVHSASAWSGFNKNRCRGWLRAAAVVFWIAVLPLSAAGAYQLGHRWIGGAEHWTLTNEMFPREAVNFLAANPQLPRDIYNPYEWGGFLEFYAYPRVRCFQDGRAHTVFSEQRYAEGLYAEYEQPWRLVLRQHKMESLLADTPDFSKVFDKYHIDLVLSSRILGNLSERMRRLPQWTLIYSDEVSDIYVRRSRLDAQASVAFVYPLTAQACRLEAEDCLRRGSSREAYRWGCRAVGLNKADLQGYLIAAAAAWQDNRSWEGIKYSAGAFFIDYSSPVLWYNLGVWAERSGYAGTGRCLRRIADICGQQP